MTRTTFYKSIFLYIKKKIRVTLFSSLLFYIYIFCKLQLIYSLNNINNANN